MFAKYLLSALFLISIHGVKAEPTNEKPLIGASIIEGPAASGTGVVIGKNKNVYTFLTAAHVVSDASSAEPIRHGPTDRCHLPGHRSDR